MSVTKHRLRQVAAVALVAITALGAAAACGDKSPEASSDKPAKLVVDTFGEFGYEGIVAQYEKDTGIKVELRKTAQLSDYRPKLVRYLATGKGAADVVALEEGIINEFKVNPANWVDLKPYVGDKSADYLKWKYELGKAPDGKLMGLPTDVGSLAVCYRRDLFQAANLPVDRDAVSKLWPTWDAFIETGVKYRTATGKGMVDSVTTAASAVMFQVGGDIFYDKDNQLYEADGKTLVASKSKAVKDAWDTAIKMADAKITAKTSTWSNEWSAGFKNGTFAATFCPSWMTGIIQENSGPDNKGKWDVAAVPGGSGNWGGSWLGVPTQSKYPKAAAELAAYLTNAKSQVEAFKKSGPLPTNLQALQDPAFQDFKNDYFNGAPTGKIFGSSVANIQPVNLGPKHGGVKEEALEPALQSYEQGKVDAAGAWAQFLKDVPLQGSY